jgi:hypothetical protein
MVGKCGRSVMILRAPLNAFRDHGRVQPTLEAGAQATGQALARLATLPAGCFHPITYDHAPRRIALHTRLRTLTSQHNEATWNSEEQLLLT